MEEITVTLPREAAETLLDLLAAETDYPADRWADAEIDRLDTCYGRLRDTLGLDPAARLDAPVYRVSPGTLDRIEREATPDQPF